LNKRVCVSSPSWIPLILRFSILMRLQSSCICFSQLFSVLRILFVL
jgi:hypothetical protein